MVGGDAVVKLVLPAARRPLDARGGPQHRRRVVLLPAVRGALPRLRHHPRDLRAAGGLGRGDVGPAPTAGGRAVVRRVGHGGGRAMDLVRRTRGRGLRPVAGQPLQPIEPGPTATAAEHLDGQGHRRRHRAAGGREPVLPVGRDFPRRILRLGNGQHHRVEVVASLQPGPPSPPGSWSAGAGLPRSCVPCCFSTCPRGCGR